MTGWDRADLPEGIEIGDGCVLARRESFDGFRSARRPGLVLGDGVVVHEWTGFSVHREGRVDVGRDTILAGAAIWCSEAVVIGERAVVSYNVLITDADMHPIDPDLRREDVAALGYYNDAGAERQPAAVRPVTIGDDVRIGIGAIVLKGTRIGAGATVAPGSVVTGEVPAGAHVEGNPGRVMGGAAG